MSIKKSGNYVGVDRCTYQRILKLLIISIKNIRPMYLPDILNKKSQIISIKKSDNNIGEDRCTYQIFLKTIRKIRYYKGFLGPMWLPEFLNKHLKTMSIKKSDNNIGEDRSSYQIFNKLLQMSVKLHVNISPRTFVYGFLCLFMYISYGKQELV